MRRFGRFMGRALVVCLLLWGGLLLVPREMVNVEIRFDDTLLDGGVAPYLTAREARFDDITDGAQKRVIWAGEPDSRAPWAVVYIHGFSATSQDIRPLPALIADNLRAHLVLTRLAGHGRQSWAMGQPQVSDWMDDVAEALAIGRRIGDRVLVIGTSTGGTLATIAAADPAMRQDVAGMVLIAPNFKLLAPEARLLTWPGVRWWGPLVAGRTQTITPRSADHEMFWTTSYPTTALIPMALTANYGAAMDHTALTIPTLFVFADGDRVVDSRATRRVIKAWGGPTKMVIVEPGAVDDPKAHVIAGDILSPGQTDGIVAKVLGWVAGL